MPSISFSKYQGTGNDFILIDNRTQALRLTQAQIEKMCHRRYGIGADGLMLLETAPPGYDFRMVYYNADGREGSMCGNGGRCITRFAFDQGIRPASFQFLAIDGPHEAHLQSNGRVKLKMNDVNTIMQGEGWRFANTGSPHVVVQVDALAEYPVVQEGRRIRHSDRYAQEGVNVNFVAPVKPGQIAVRTFERGVEDETLSCGTGVTAAALMYAPEISGPQRVEVHTPGGDLVVTFHRKGENQFDDIWLEGPAVKVFEGVINLE